MVGCSYLIYTFVKTVAICQYAAKQIPKWSDLFPHSFPTLKLSHIRVPKFFCQRPFLPQRRRAPLTPTVQQRVGGDGRYFARQSRPAGRATASTATAACKERGVERGQSNNASSQKLACQATEWGSEFLRACHTVAWQASFCELARQRWPGPTHSPPLPTLYRITERELASTINFRGWVTIQ